MQGNYYFPVMWLVIGALGIGLALIANAVARFRGQVAADAALADACARQLRVLGAARRVLWLFTGLLTLGGLAAMLHAQSARNQHIAAMRQQKWPAYERGKTWLPPDPYLAETDAEAERIAYGRDLIAHTQDYFGPNGLVKAGAINGLNCQNCHLDAGSRPFGNNYAAVASTYPQMRARSGSLETIPKRVNDCFERSLNGQPLDSNSREMRAIVAYLNWLGTGVPKGEKPKGAGLVEPAFLDRAADPARGQAVYAAKCASCHGAAGQGLPMPEGTRQYPALWGADSYNEGAGLFRLSRFAAFVKTNMPWGATHDNPQLSDAEAWDLAAFVNTQPRPKHPFLDSDWPKIEQKPYDHPFGPFADTFPAQQHKYGPFGPIVAFYKR